jgi:hypothetical protein
MRHMRDAHAGDDDDDECIGGVLSPCRWRSRNAFTKVPFASASLRKYGLFSDPGNAPRATPCP